MDRPDLTAAQQAESDRIFAEKRGYRGPSALCPHCREAARSKEYRAKDFVSLLGTLRPERGY